MAKVHTIARGECLSSVAYAHQHFWQTLWEHPQNAALRERRGNPHVLYEGDSVFIPDPEPKQVAAATEQPTFVEQATLPAQRTIVGTVQTLPTLALVHQVSAPALIFIGGVVALHEQLAPTGARTAPA